MINFIINIFKKKKQKKVRPLDDYEFNALKKERMDRVDKILEKISSGKKLKKEEEEFLKKYN